MPGLIECHVHLMGQSSPNSYIDRYLWNNSDYAVRSTVWAQRTLKAGFTTVRDLIAVPGDPTEDIRLMEKVSFVMNHEERAGCEEIRHVKGSFNPG